MRVVRYSDPAAFWAATRDFLERDELGNTQLLSIGQRRAADPGPSPPACFAVVDGSGRPVAAAIVNPEGTLFASPASTAMLRLLLDGVAAGETPLRDIVAESRTARDCAELTGVDYTPHIGLQLYRLERVAGQREVPGRLREADEGDLPLLAAWQRVFLEEIAARNVTDTPEELVRRRFAAGSGNWLWEVDGTPVAHAGHRPTPVRSARIAPVYTVPGQRGRGYAGALVAAVCDRLLAAGRYPIYLFADLANPTANGVYRRVGFEAVAEHLHLMPSTQ